MKIIPFPKKEYEEVSQKFPLYYKIGRYSGDVENGFVLEELSSWAKCREFLNDVVYWRQLGSGAHYFKKYGFENPEVVPNCLIFQEGALLATFKNNSKLFQGAMAIGAVEYEWIKEDTLFFHTDIFNHCFRVALVTYIIKVLCQKKWETLKQALEECEGNEKQIQRDYKLSPEVLMKALSILPKIGEQSQFSSNPHGMGVGVFLCPKINTPDVMDVKNALSSM